MPSPAPPPLVDATVLADLDGALGPAFVVECITLYLADAQRLRAEVTDALTGGDPPTITRAVHALGSSSATIGAQALAELCRGVERAGADARTGAALAACYEATVTALGAERDRRGQ